MKKWKVIGTKHGKEFTVIVEASDHKGAVTAGSKGRHCLVVHTVVLID